MEAFAAGPIAGIGRSFELQSPSLAKEKDCTNMVQVVLLDTKANILKYSNNRETIITTTNYNSQAVVRPRPLVMREGGVILARKDQGCHYSSETQNQ